jgi:hypothetical protein
MKQKIIKIDINKVNTYKNNVLIRMVDDNEKIVGKSGLEFWVDTSYQKGDYSHKHGVLAKLPTKITYCDKGVPWRNNSRPSVGDEVWYKYNLDDTKDIYQSGDDFYCLVPYRDLVLSHNRKCPESSILMLNGYMLAQKMKMPKENELDITDRDYPDRYIIVYAGEHNREYVNELWIDDNEIDEGCEVMTRFDRYPELEYDLQLRFDGNKYYYFQRKEVVGVFNR